MGKEFRPASPWLSCNPPPPPPEVGLCRWAQGQTSLLVDSDGFSKAQEGRQGRGTPGLEPPKEDSLVPLGFCDQVEVGLGRRWAGCCEGEPHRGISLSRERGSPRPCYSVRALDLESHRLNSNLPSNHSLTVTQGKSVNCSNLSFLIYKMGKSLPCRVIVTVK